MRNNIEEKYQIEYIDKAHVYKLDVDDRTWDLQYTSPHTTIFNGTYITESTWSKLVETIIGMCLEDLEKTKEELLDIELSWTKQKIFCKEKKLEAYQGPFNNGLYINLNFNAKHIVYILLDLLFYFEIDTTQIEIFYRIKPAHESNEISDYFYNKAKSNLYEYLLINKRYTEKKTESFFKGVEKLDILFSKKFINYKSLILFENKLEYATIKSKFYRIEIQKIKDLKIKKNIKSILDILTDYYGYMY
jgi:hypothetical protein